MEQARKYLPGLYSLVEELFVSLEQSLTTQSYGNIISILKPILTVSLILLAIYIIYSVLHFFHSLVVLKRIKIRIIFSVIVALLSFAFLFVIYDYLFGLTFFNI